MPGKLVTPPVTTIPNDPMLVKAYCEGRAAAKAGAAAGANPHPANSPNNVQWGYGHTSWTASPTGAKRDACALPYGGSTLTPPINTVAPAVTGTGTVGQTLTCTDGTWTGTATITYTKQWFAGADAIAGATANTLVIPAAASGKSVTCQVTARNAVSYGRAVSNATAVA